jgi:hypothetical protein
MKIIKIIDLLNKIANGEEVPKKIKYEGKIYIYYEAYAGYYEKDCEGIYNKKFLTFRNEQYYKVLNEELEILDEEDDFEGIEEVNILTDGTNMNYVANDEYGKLSYSKIDLLKY